MIITVSEGEIQKYTHITEREQHTSLQSHPLRNIPHEIVFRVLSFKEQCENLPFP